MGNSLVTGDIPAQRAGNAENVSIWWRHHESIAIYGHLLASIVPLAQLFSHLVMSQIVLVANQVNWGWYHQSLSIFAKHLWSFIFTPTQLFLPSNANAYFKVTRHQSKFFSKMLHFWSCKLRVVYHPKKLDLRTARKSRTPLPLAWLRLKMPKPLMFKLTFPWVYI